MLVAHIDPQRTFKDAPHQRGAVFVSRIFVIRLTRLRQDQPFYLNPDLFERVDTHVDSVIRLRDGSEYVVVEPASEIIKRIVEYRAYIIAVANAMTPDVVANGFSTSGTYAKDAQPQIASIEAVDEPSPWAPSDNAVRSTSQEDVS